MRRTFGLLTLASIAACAGARPPAAQPAQETAESAAHAEGKHGHGHGHGPGPLVHRFANAEQWADQFDDPERAAWQHPDRVIAAMQIEPDMVVADIGAGTGYFEPWLSRAVGDGGQVLALDIEPDMVRYLDERARREGLTNVRAALVATEDPNLPARGVDRVLIVDTWHHIAGREAYAAKLRQALKPQGRVFIVDFKLDAKRGPPVHHRLPPKTVVQELTAGGLVAEILPADLPEQYIVVGRSP